MALAFVSPSMRAAGSDLTISVSPLGLIELADEEFEVHGPRLTRYANAAAFYLGHHWAYRRPPGEPQVTANYVAALSDFLVNFTFGKGIQFLVDKAFDHIVPALLDRVWSQDNNKDSLLWSIGNSGSVYGDSFTKIAYDPAWSDSTGMPHPGRCRILPVNPSFCFPEWHPHDAERMIRFKLKYRFWTTSAEGTRIVCTYVEIITDDFIEEYVNDQLIDRRPNPLGFIPVVHIANKPVLASPWGLSDIQDIIPLNRTYNETATDILDIINYHTAPVTIITGAKASNLEMGANKVWSLQQKDARVENLAGGFEGLGPALEFLDRIKTWMHELTGVPETSLGQEQAISNTSGVALAIQYFPTMLRYHLKKVQYGIGFKKINEMVLRTLFVFEPDSVYFNPDTSGLMKDGQVPFLDPADPQVYQCDIKWPEPLPTDTLVKLNEIQAKLMLELESKKGALGELGEQFPDEKLQELWEEQVQDLKMAAAKRIVDAQVNAAIVALTGMVPEGAGDPVQGAETTETETRKPDGTKTTQTKQTTPGIQQQPGLPSLPGLGDLSGLVAQSGMQTISDLVTQAYGTKLPQRRIIDKNDNDGISQ
jgi:hypothetical protein